MTDAQWHFAGSTRPVEELYDCQTDPQNLKNLADSKAHQKILKRLRNAHRKHITQTVDLGFLPESEAWQMFSKQTGWELGQSGQVKMGAIHRAAAQGGTADEPPSPKISPPKTPASATGPRLVWSTATR